MRVSPPKSSASKAAPRGVLLLICALALHFGSLTSEALGAGNKLKPARARRHLIMSLVLDRWAQPLLGQQNLQAAYRTLRYFEEVRRWGPHFQNKLFTEEQERFFSQMVHIKAIVSPAFEWAKPVVDYETRASLGRRSPATEMPGVHNVVRLRKTSRTSWNFGFEVGGTLAWCEEQLLHASTGTPLERGGPNNHGRFIKVAGLRWGETESAFLIVDNGYAPQVLTLDFDKVDSVLTLHNVQAGTVAGQAPLVEYAQLAWRDANQWDVITSQRNYHKVGYRRLSSNSSVWPTALGDAPPRHGDLESCRPATHYASYDRPGHVDSSGARLAASFTGTLGDMFIAGLAKRHTLPGEHESLVLLETLRRHTW